MVISKRENRGRSRRARRIRKKIFGTSDRPRLCVRRSLKHIYAQLVDDEKGITIIQVGSAGKRFTIKTDGIKADGIKTNGIKTDGIKADGARADGKNKSVKSAAAKTVGELLAEKAKEKGVTKVVFDRKGYLYHGRIKALADAARSKGLVF
jgi:large subunit ribosomal protein L18